MEQGLKIADDIAELAHSCGFHDKVLRRKAGKDRQDRIYETVLHGTAYATFHKLQYFKVLFTGIGTAQFLSINAVVTVFIFEDYGISAGAAYKFFYKSCLAGA